MSPPDGGGGPAPRNLLHDLGGAAAAAALSLAVAVIALQLWSWHASVPLTYSTDALYYDGVVKGTLDHGWYLHNPDLGAPYGLDSHDFPVVSNDSLQLLIVKGLGLFTDRPFLVSNAFFLLTFPLNAVGAFGALRWRRTPRPLAVLGAAVFGILPLHFMKGIDYLFFVSAYMVPIGCAMVLTVLADEPLFGRRPVPGLRGLVRWRTAAVVVLCAAIASASIYYAVFTSLLLGTAALARGLLSRSRRPLVEGLGAVGLIGIFVALNQLPTILYRLQHGPNPIVAARDPAETEFYGLKLIQLVLPVPGHRVGALADLTDRYRATSKVIGEPSTSIGLLATVGLAWLVVAALLAILGPDRRVRASAGERHAAFVVMVAFLWANAGGISTIVSYTVTAQLRAWSRMSVYLGFFGIVGALALLDRLRRRLAPRAGLPVLAAVLAGLFVLAALDQTSDRLAPDHATIEREYRSDAEFVRRIESRLPSGSALLQLPYVAYPEVPPTHRLGAYDELRPYLHSTRLRWSFAAMKGRPEDWHGDLTAAPLRSLLAGAVAGGLSGVVVDRFGFTDGAAALERELGAIVGPAAVVAANDRLAFWDLRPVGERLRAAAQPMGALADVTLRPLHLDYEDGFYAEEAAPGLRWRWAPERGRISVHNPADTAREAIFSATVETARPGTTHVHLPDGTTETIRPGDPGAGVVQRRVRVPPGRSELRVESTAEPLPQTPGESRRLVVRLVDVALVPVELCEAATVLGAPDGEGGCLEAASGAHRP